MRIRFEFDMSYLPVAYRLGLLSIIKEMVRTSSESFYSHVFEGNKNLMKPFAHASYIRNIGINGGEITGTELALTVSSSSYEFMMHLMNGSERETVYNYRGFKLKLKNKRLLPNPPSFSSIITFKTLSPLLIEDERRKPLLAGDELFEQEFNYFAQLIVKEFYYRSLHEPLQVQQTSMKKVVIKESLHQEQTTPIFMTVNQGLIQVKGHPEDLQAIYHMGIGRRRSLGLGLLDIEEVTYP